MTVRFGFSIYKAPGSFDVTEGLYSLGKILAKSICLFVIVCALFGEV